MKHKKYFLLLLALSLANSFIPADENLNNNSKTDPAETLNSISFRNEKNDKFKFLAISAGYLKSGYNSIMLISNGTPFSAINAVYANNSYYLAIYNFILFGPIIICLPLIFTGIPFIVFNFIKSNYSGNKNIIKPFFSFNHKSKSTLIGIKINLNKKKE